MLRRLLVWVTRVTCLLLLLLAVPLGAVGAVSGFFGAALATSSTFVLALSGALVLVLLTGGLSLLASRGLFGRRAARRWVPLLVTGGTLLVVGVAAGGLVFRPMDVSYIHHKEPTERTRHWDLPTGSRLAYERTPAEGEPKPMPVVVLHGGPGTPDRFERSRVDQELAGAGFDVYHYDQVGAGLSGRLENVSGYTVARHVADLEAVREEIGAERLVLVGGSWGATLAAHYMAAHPDRVERAVFTAPGAIWAPAFAESKVSEGREGEIISEAATLRFVAVLALQDINPKAAENLAPDREMSAFFQDLLSQVLASDMAGCNPAGEPEVSAEGRRTPIGYGYYANTMTTASVDRSDDPRSVLGKVETPVLVVRPECDRLRWEVAREYRDVLPDSRLVVVDGAGHSVESSRPELYADLVRAFLLKESLPLEPYTADEPPG